MNATGVVTSARAGTRPGEQVRDLLSHRDLLLLLIQKELKVKYKGTMLGMLWSLLSPLLMMVVYTAVFSVIARFPMTNYPIFLLAALLPWTAFTATVGASVASIVTNGNLVRRVKFPVAMLPATTVIANLVNLLPGFAVLLVFCLAFRQPLGWPLLMLPVLVLLQGIFTLGIALIFSSLNVYFRDLEYLVGVGLLVWFFGTPVLYPLSVFSGKRLGVLIELNPLTWLMDSYQHIWHGNAWPAWDHLAAFMAAAIVIFGLGVLVFGKASRRFGEEV